MSDIFKKLNLKSEREILVVNSPDSFEPEISALSGVSVRRDPGRARSVKFALAFVTQADELDRLARALTSKAEGDAVLWFAYPKKSSKKYRCEFSRDTGWGVLGEAGFEGVRQVAIDEDWSALRFRRVQFIKTLKRDSKRALSAAGKARAGKVGTK